MAQATPPPMQQAPPAYPNLPTRQSTQPPPFPVGIAAGAEDVKYQAKYKDLKRKVKEIEADNDKLHFKVLQAKRSIQRMKLERAILYERLQQVPPSPELQDRHPLPPVHPPPPHQHHALAPNHIPREIDRTPPEYMRSHARNAPIDSPIGQPHSSRRGSVQYMPHMPPVPQDHRGHTQIHTSPHMHERARSPSRGRGHPAPGTYHPHAPQQYVDVQHSPPASERDRPRRHELHHELTPSHGRPPMPPHSPPDARSSRIHNHQRLGPGTYINREDMVDPQREREWDRGRATREMHSPPMHRVQYAETHAAPVPRRREEQTSYFGTRSNSVGSASGSGSVVGERDRERGDRDAPPSRPDSRTAFYEPDRGSRSFRLRPVQPQEEVDFVHEDGQPKSRDRNGSSGGGGGGGGYPPEQSRPPHDSRKRSRNDMDVDDADDGPPGAMYGRHSDSKRYHPAS
ncbi:hypothetical protein FB45DRAFT_904784 [Roridomyces roridus]|uniref:INO80 complex subunit F domain-containing protein n=1 Tax=Roridomyces roridus TaxID=1738132 RepID=A0AAD7C5F1_9AGAR|nr:hypothetical protein FB45DRAFT_904784 [Roridomyces roridus]